MTKVDKVSVHYVAASVSHRWCSDCAMFRAPGSCTMVKGRIARGGTCDLWEAIDSGIQKDAPSVGDVHVSTALGNEQAVSGQGKKRRWKDFKTFVGQTGGVKVVVPSDHGPGANPIGDPAYKRAGKKRIFPEGSNLRVREPGSPSDGKGRLLTEEELRDAARRYVGTPAYKRYGSTKDLPKPVKNKLKGKDRRQWMHVFNSSLASHGDESRAFAEAWSVANKADALSNPPLVGVGGRRLEPYDANMYFTPFRFDGAALGYLREDQIPRFLDAATHPDRLALAEVPLAPLIGIKNRVSPEVILNHLRDLGETDPPVVIAMNDDLYLVDGHDRATAHWLNGEDSIVVRFDDIREFSSVKPDPDVDHEGPLFDLLQGVNGRTLVSFRDGTLMVPFSHDPYAIAKLRPDQVPSFIYAITHPKELDTEEVSLASLVAIQNRVNGDTVAKHVENGAPKVSKKKPVILRNNGVNYIADGHDRLTAAWLRGEDKATVVVKDVTALDNTMKREPEESISFSVEIAKALPDRQQIFGWASVCTIGGEHVIDKQNDIVPVAALEPAVYEYVLSSRSGGDMHVEKGVSRLIESVMFTKEKQDVLGIDLGREGWWGGWQIDSPRLWADIKAGRRPELSIGGAAVSKEI